MLKQRLISSCVLALIQWLKEQLVKEYLGVYHRTPRLSRFHLIQAVKLEYCKSNNNMAQKAGNIAQDNGSTQTQSFEAIPYCTLCLQTMTAA